MYVIGQHSSMWSCRTTYCVVFLIFPNILCAQYSQINCDNNLCIVTAYLMEILVVSLPLIIKRCHIKIIYRLHLHKRIFKRFRWLCSVSISYKRIKVFWKLSISSGWGQLVMYKFPVFNELRGRVWGLQTKWNLSAGSGGELCWHLEMADDSRSNNFGLSSLLVKKLFCILM